MVFLIILFFVIYYAYGRIKGDIIMASDPNLYIYIYNIYILILIEYL